MLRHPRPSRPRRSPSPSSATSRCARAARAATRPRPGSENAIKTMSTSCNRRRRRRSTTSSSCTRRKSRPGRKPFQQSIFSDAGSRALLRIVQERWQRLAAKTQALTPLTANGQDGPRDDLEFPRHFFAREHRRRPPRPGAPGRRELDELRLGEPRREIHGGADAARRRRLPLRLRAGDAAARPRPVRRASARLLLVVGVAWAASIAAELAEGDPEERRRRVLRPARSRSRRPPTAPASRARSTTSRRQSTPGPGSPARTSGGRTRRSRRARRELQSTLIPVDALERVISDLQAVAGARARQRAPLPAARRLGVHARPPRPARALQQGRRARARGDRRGAERPGRALRARDLAPRRRRREGGAQRRTTPRSTRRSTPRSAASRGTPRSSSRCWVSGALSDLEALREAKPDLGDEIDGLKGLVVGSVAAGKVTEPRGDASFTGMQSTVHADDGRAGCPRRRTTGFYRSPRRSSPCSGTRRPATTPGSGCPRCPAPTNPRRRHRPAVPRAEPDELLDPAALPRHRRLPGRALRERPLAGDTETTATWGKQNGVHRPGAQPRGLLPRLVEASRSTRCPDSGRDSSAPTASRAST